MGKFTEVQVEMDNLLEEHKSISQEIQDAKDIAQGKKALIDGALSCLVSKKEENQRYIEERLKVLAQSVPQKETKTQSKVALLSGSLVIKKPTQTLVADKDKLIAWAKEQARLEYIDEKVVQSFKWKEYKGNLDIIDGQVVDTITGEVVTVGVQIENKPEELVIK